MPGHEVAGRGRVAQRRHGVDHPLDALAGPSRPQVSIVGRPEREAGAAGGDRGAVRDGRHLGRVDVEAAAQPLARRLGHDDDPVGERGDLDEDRPLVRCRLAQDGVGDHDGRDPQVAEDVEHLVAVGAAVEAVLVLDDRDVALVQQIGSSRPRTRRAVDQLADHLRVAGSVLRRPTRTTLDLGADGAPAHSRGRR